VYSIRTTVNVLVDLLTVFDQIMAVQNELLSLVYEARIVVNPRFWCNLSLCVIDDFLVHVLRNLACKGHGHANDSGSVETRKTAEDLIWTIELLVHMMRE
jgi:hypothetical protein